MNHVSVWLRQGRETIRLELMDRFGRPPVVTPHLTALRRLVGEATGAGRQRPLPAREDEPLRRARLDRLLADTGDREMFLRRAAGANHVRLVIPDATRRGPWIDWVPACARWLSDLTPQAVSRIVLVATGVHRTSLPEGLDLPAGWTAIPNGQGGYAAHREVGRTPQGTPVRLHPSWVDGDLKVVLADVSFHYFAGFGGGRKLVYPGLGEPDGILSNHRLTLDREGRLKEECTSGRLEDNPVHRDLLDAVSFSPPDLLITAFEGEPGGAQLLTVGDWRASHEAACIRFREGHLLPHTQRPEVVIADAGGHPRDATFLQAHKSLQHAARFVPDGGRLLLVAGLEEGCGSPTLERLWGLEAGELRRRAIGSYELHTHTALAFRSVLDRLEVGVWCRSDPGFADVGGIRALATADEAVAWLVQGGGPRSWGWLTRAEEVLPRLAGWGSPATEAPAASGSERTEREA